jgi:hypothetical protein
MAFMNYFDSIISNKTNTVVQIDERRKLMFMDADKVAHNLCETVCRSTFHFFLIGVYK